MMPESTWNEYFETYADYLDKGRTAIASGGRLPAMPVLVRPSCPLPEDQAWTVLELLTQGARALRGSELSNFSYGGSHNNLAAMVRARTKQRRRHRLSRAYSALPEADDSRSWKRADHEVELAAHAQ